MATQPRAQVDRLSVAESVPLRPAKIAVSRGPTVWILLTLTALNCVLQVVLFWRFTHLNINFDAVSYVGIARRVASGHLRDSLHGYWSPLISWCMAAVSFLFNDFTLAGHLVTIASFLLCLPLLYILTLRLWGQPKLAAVAVLWFSLARGVASFSVSFVGADFLLTACVLAYFIQLLQCLRQPSSRNWFWLGVPHAVAFLAKAFAMPWLALATLIASFVSVRHNRKRALVQLCMAALVPGLVWVGWGMALKTRYGVFTPGYQSKWNLIDQTKRDTTLRASGKLSVLLDTSRIYDEYTVVETMYPGSPLWQAQLDAARAIRQILNKERQNLPQAIKETVILVTPAGLLAFGLMLVVLLRHRKLRPEAHLLWIIMLSAATLMIGYCMLVFDRRYVLPLGPLLIASAVPLVLPTRWAPVFREEFARTRLFAFGLLVASVVFFQVYWASPFRELRRDHQLLCYDAAQALREAPSCRKLVVIGAGPFPEHGVGWEAGIYASYFAGCRMVAFSQDLPAQSQSAGASNDLALVAPDAVLLFGPRENRAFRDMYTLVREFAPDMQSRPIRDPEAGEVGEVFWKPSKSR